MTALQALLGAALVVAAYRLGWTHGMRAHGNAWERSGTREHAAPRLRCLLWLRRAPWGGEGVGASALRPLTGKGRHGGGPGPTRCSTCGNMHLPTPVCPTTFRSMMRPQRPELDTGRVGAQQLQTPAQRPRLALVPAGEICPTCRRPCRHVGDHPCPVDG